MKTLDRTPPLTSDSPRHRRSRGKCVKPFRIECRYVGPDIGNSYIGRLLMHDREWHVCGAYETERARRDAYRALTTKGDWYGRNREFRIV